MQKINYLQINHEVSSLGPSSPFGFVFYCLTLPTTPRGSLHTGPALQTLWEVELGKRAEDKRLSGRILQDMVKEVSRERGGNSCRGEGSKQERKRENFTKHGSSSSLSSQHVGD